MRIVLRGLGLVPLGLLFDFYAQGIEKLLNYLNKFFCKFLEHLWCFLKGFWRLLVGPGKLLLDFGTDFLILSAGPPGPVRLG